MKTLQHRQLVLLKTIFLLTIFALTACKTQCDCGTIDRKAIDGETLYKICKYIVDNKKIAVPANPCEWQIREMKDDTLNGKQIIRVTMTCCFMGDQIIIDKKTNEVIGYMASDK
jgi:hypothetical protein